MSLLHTKQFGIVPDILIVTCNQEAPTWRESQEWFYFWAKLQNVGGVKRSKKAWVI